MQTGKDLELVDPAARADRRLFGRQRDERDPRTRRLCRADAARGRTDLDYSPAVRPRGAGDRRRPAGALHRLVGLSRSEARNEIFNITNGDVFVWPNVWPAIADALGLPPAITCRCRSTARSGRARPSGRRSARQHGLRSGTLREFVGLSFEYADYTMGYGRTEPGPPALVSTIKLMQAGFTEVMDTEAMFAKYFAEMQANRLLPRI